MSLSKTTIKDLAQSFPFSTVIAVSRLVNSTFDNVKLEVEVGQSPSSRRLYPLLYIPRNLIFHFLID